MSQYKSQVQNQFLSTARKKHLKVEVVLETGTILRGKVRAYDQFSVSLALKDKVEVVYKSSIIYISCISQRTVASRKPMGGRSGGYYSRPTSDRKFAYGSTPAPRRPLPVFEEDDDFVEEDDPPPPKKPPRC
ncbi:MAG: hypothetical protein Kow0029_06750 [Candidatus Rifleibacteriota bacterium]